MTIFLLLMSLAFLIGFWLGARYGKWRGFRIVHEEDKQRAKGLYETRKKKYL